MQSPCIALIGSGGKTTTMLALAQALRDRRVLLTTTTHIYPVAPPVSRKLLVDPTRQQLERELSEPGIVCAGTAGATAKLSPLPRELFTLGRSLAQITLCEADGSRQLPLKLHRPGEPVIPPGCDRCVIVAGLSALGQPISQAVHRWQRFGPWEADSQRPVTVDTILFCVRDALSASGMCTQRCRVLLNQADTAPEAGGEIARILEGEGISCRAGSAMVDPAFLAPWILDGLF